LDLRSWIFVNQLNEETNRYDDNRYDSMDDPKVKGTFHEYGETTIKGISIQTNYKLHRYGLVSLGLNGRNEEFENKGVIRDVKASGGNFNLRNFYNNTELHVYSAALEYEVSPFQDTMVVLGYSHNWLDAEDKGSDDDGSYLIGGYYDISQNTRIKASYARKIRFPSLRQLYEEVSGNPNLTTEKSDNYEIGVEQKLPLNSNIALTGFLIDVDDYIEKDDTTDRFENNEKYRFQGFELTAQTRFVRNALLAMGYTYLDTEDRSSGTEKEELQYRPKHKFTMEGKYVFDFGLAPYISLMYVGDQYFYSKKPPLSKKKLNDFTLVNVKVDQNLLKGKLLLYLGVDNLFDVDYEESYGFPQAGRLIYGGVVLNL
jgi:outer membrane receptor protein involved in Fe transport